MKRGALSSRCALFAGLLVAACSHGPDRRRERPPGDLPPAELAQARAEFAAVTADYASAAKVSLDEKQCEALSRRFIEIHQRYGPELILSWFNAGAVWEDCGETAKAEEIYRAILAVDPQFDLAHNNLGVIHWNRHEQAKALEHFKRAVQANPHTPTPRNNLAAALRDQYVSSAGSEAFDAAERHLQNALALDSSDRSAFENLARLYYDRGRLRDASYLLLAELVVTQGQRVLEAEGRRSADLYNLQGLLLIERSNQVDALRAFKQAVEVEPAHADAHMNIAMIALRFRDYAQAERSIRVALEDPRQQTNVEAWLGLGVAHRGLRKYEEARAAFEQAAKLGSADPRASYNLGILHQEHIAPGQVAEDGGKRANQVARRHFARVVERGDASESVRATVADARKRMQSIDEYLEAIRVADELEKRAAEADRARAEEARRERERLLELEKRALESQSSSRS